jgi:hypothetical protein
MAFVTGFYYFAMVCYSIQQGGGHFGVAEDLRPLAEVQICRDNGGASLSFKDVPGAGWTGRVCGVSLRRGYVKELG